MPSSKPVNTQPRFAIALEYDGKSAPVVTARGHHEVADEILQIAQQEKVPIQGRRVDVTPVATRSRRSYSGSPVCGHCGSVELRLPVIRQAQGFHG